MWIVFCHDKLMKEAWPTMCAHKKPNFDLYQEHDKELSQKKKDGRKTVLFVKET